MKNIVKEKVMTEKNKAEQDYMCEKMEGYCVEKIKFLIVM